MRHLLRGLITLALCGTIDPCVAQDVASEGPIVVQPGALRLAVERLRAPGEQPLVLAEMAVLSELPWSLYAGPALFGAVAGERGGFFVAGVETGWRAGRREGIGLDAGFFVGGGGGGAAPVGGGLMLRPRLAITWSTRQDRWSVGVARATFPSGEIRSSQVHLAWERRFGALLSRDPLEPWESTREGADLRFRPVTLEAVMSRRLPLSHPAGAAVQWTDLVGVATRFGMTGPLLLRVEGHAAYRGDSGGYMEVLGGPELRVGMGPRGRIALVGTLEAGSGGGGGIDTGGGLLVKAAGGLDLEVVSFLHLGTEAGLVAAPWGSLRAATFGVKLGSTFELASAGGEAASSPPSGRAASALSWRFRPSVRRYATSQRSTSSQPSVPVEDLAFQADLLLSEALYLTAQSGWALGGQAGAWATGLLGGGVASPSWGRHRVGVEALAGAGGGGGISTEGGALLHAAAWWSCALTSRVGVELSAGRARAIGGRFDSSVLGAGLVFRGSALARSVPAD